MENKLTDEKVSELLGSLQRVDCPGDFDVRVKARIASAIPGKRNGSMLFPVLRYAVPLGLVLGIIAAVSINSFLDIENGNVPELALEVTDRPVMSESEPPVALRAANAPERTAETAMAVNTFVSNGGPLPANAAAERRVRTVLADTAGSGSVVRSLRGSRPAILPRGFNVEPMKEAGDALPAAEPTGDALTVLGIESDAKLSVKKVAAGSLADKAGVKPGDLIEAANGTGIVNKKALPDGSKIRSIKVLRNGRSIEIPF